MQIVYKRLPPFLLIGMVACSTFVAEPNRTSRSMLLATVAAQMDETTSQFPPLVTVSKTSPKPTTEPAIESTATLVPTVQVKKPVPDIKMRVEDIRREGNYARASACCDLPDDSDWMIDQAILRYGGGAASLDSAGYLELVPLSLDGKEGHRCDEVTFIIPDQADISLVTLTVERLRAIPNEGEYCDIYLNEVQPTLDARQRRIKLDCAQVDQGFRLSVVEKPDSLSQEEAERAVYDFYTISGPWTFQFNELPSFIFDPLPYNVEADASNFQREGDLVMIDVCVQIDNNDWESWQV